MSQNFYSNQNSASPNVALAHTIAGEPVQGTQGIASGGDIQPARGFSTLPYKPPKRRDRDNPDKILCAAEDCKAFPIRATGYCAGHSRSMGLVDWKKGGRKKAEPDDNAD